MKLEPIYLDKKGYDEFLQSIEEIKEQIKKNDLGRKEAFDAGAGDGWDSPEFEEIERTSIRLTGELKRKAEELKRIVIIERDNNEELIDIGDVILASIEYAKDDLEDMKFKLVGSSGDLFAELPEVSINSPLGSSVYKKKVGDRCSYSVNNRVINVLIKEKLDLQQLEETQKTM